MKKRYDAIAHEISRAADILDQTNIMGLEREEFRALCEIIAKARSLASHLRSEVHMSRVREMTS